ncbi:hypothetical protein [Antarctobacter jejuensis]|uniref:hypothetical protein n=1 Tax=Antarctobacter jejuensis TaxID=1439938 RepID=UPI003FD531AC
MTATEEIAEAGRALRAALAYLSDELASYPGPVAGCDAQYTHLLATRSRVRKALNALDAEVFVATPRTLRPGAGVESR